MKATFELQNWLVTQLAKNIDIDPDEIDVTLPFSYYGFDSVAAIGLSGELEAKLGRKLSPTLIWDYPTISSLADYLSQDSFKQMQGV